MKKKAPDKKNSMVRFSIRSSFFVLFGILLATLVFPLLLDTLGLQLNPLRVLVIGLTSGFVVSYSLYFIDSNKGMSKGFWITFAIFAVVSAVISYFWVYNIYFV